MFILYFFEGLAIGFILAMPVGPIGVLCVRRTLEYGTHQGIMTGLIGAIADILFLSGLG